MWGDVPYPYYEIPVVPPIQSNEIFFLKTKYSGIDAYYFERNLQYFPIAVNKLDV